jgi:hypothetical protein
VAGSSNPVYPEAVHGEGPYRDASARAVKRAAGRDGEVVLELEPEHAILSLGGRLRLVVAGRYLSLSRPGRRSRRELALDRVRLYVTRSVPTRDLALWCEVRAGVVERLVGIRPRPLLDEGGLAAMRELDQLAGELAAALAGHGHGAESAIELGRGQHRVLVVEHAERLVVYARPIFRERPRRVFEVCRDGSLVVVGRGRDRRARFASHFAVTASGDRIRFADQAGHEVASLYLPWIAPEDRAELAFPLPADPPAAAPHIDDVRGAWPLPRARPIPYRFGGLAGWRPGLRGLIGR